ncbi:hypothetical protein MLD38_014664 [Melastoma candidum]|uniref:Uncharacterized protein n=1 Tax=Melastoma candidum TaxID=119954 RepID=A0ACB9RDM3_9MYRT|nr:hypothetical protein MLD38_014664 [Melastoma candidum]
MGECCELPSDFHDDEVGSHGKENNNHLDLRLGPTGESQHDHRTRTCNASAVGWPPVASFRKNVTSSYLSKRPADAELECLSRKEENEKDYANTSEHVFIKVYMEGYPIGRKIDLRAYDGYEKLSFAINYAENDAYTPQEEHTLVYEDNEGDMILVGDVPWNMFVSTTKKLRVLRSSCVENER